MLIYQFYCNKHQLNLTGSPTWHRLDEEDELRGWTLSMHNMTCFAGQAIRDNQEYLEMGACFEADWSTTITV